MWDFVANGCCSIKTSLLNHAKWVQAKSLWSFDKGQPLRICFQQLVQPYVDEVMKMRLRFHPVTWTHDTWARVYSLMLLLTEEIIIRWGHGREDITLKSGTERFGKLIAWPESAASPSGDCCALYPILVYLICSCGWQDRDVSNARALKVAN